LRLNISWALLGNVVYAASQALMLIALAKLGSVAMVGDYALGLAVSAPIFLFANMYLNAVQATDVRGRFPFDRLLAFRLLTTGVAFALVLVIAVAGRWESEAAWALVLIGAAKAFESFSSLVHGLFQNRERMDWLGRSLVTKGMVAVVAVVAGVGLSGRLLPALIALAAAWGIVFLCYDLPRAARILRTDREHGRGTGLLRPHWDAGTVRALLPLALPLGTMALLDSVNANLPRYFLGHHSGPEAVGYYSALAYMMVAGTIVSDAVGLAARPRLARLYLEDRVGMLRILWKLLLMVAAIGVAGMAVAAFFGRQLLSLLYQPDYARHSNVFFVLMGAGAVWYLAGMLACAVVAAQRFMFLMGSYAAAGVVTAAACIQLVPSYGLAGAAWAVLAGMLVRLLLSLAAVAWLLRAPPPPSLREAIHAV
jgi:O-antigen/teichoic acid export membrane protein